MKVRNGLNIAANVCAIVLGSVLLISTIYVLLLVGSLFGGEEYAIFSITTLLLFLFCVAIIIISSLALSIKAKGNGLKIAMIVLMGILFILELIGGGIFYGILCLIPIGLEIGVLCIKPEPEIIPQNTVVVNEAQNNNIPDMQ